MNFPILLTVRQKLLGVVLLTTLVALIVALGATVAYNLREYHQNVIADMSTQSELLGHMTAPALTFDDKQLALQNLKLLQIRPTVRAAAIYKTWDGLFASYVRPGEKHVFPLRPEKDLVRIEGSQLIVFKRIISDGEFLGTVYLCIDYEIGDRVRDYLGIAIAVTILAMLIAFLMSMRLQKVVTGPILAIAGIAREVVQQRNYSRRAEKISGDEVGVLVESFNDMLAEIERRTQELENSNQEIAREVGERTLAQQEIMRLNADLEVRVHERTAQLEATNKELIVANATAESANQAKSAFLSSMSHELRTPLNAILGFTQLLASETMALTPEKRKDFTGYILKAGKHLLVLINEVLDLAKVESGTLTLSLETVVLADVMLECREMIEPLANTRTLGLSFPADEGVHVRADRTRLKQILLNLLSNAVKYNRSGGSITVECKPVGTERIRISVQDTGAGLGGEQLKQLFQPFNRLGQEGGVEDGTGIGLVVTKRLVELMGGEIGVSSTVGTGTLFWVELASAAPISRAATTARTLATASTAPVDPANATQRTLLYVEDNPENLKLVQEIIAFRSDLRLLTATDGNLGVELARTHQPEVILMDINLPGIDGNEAFRILRNHSTTAHIPVIALTANAMPREVAKSKTYGFFRYLTKPIDIHDFLEALDDALEFSKNRYRDDIET